MRLMAVVLSWNGREDTLDCLESLREVETVCVDNASSDGSAEAVASRFPDVELIRNDRNLGFAGGNNVGIRRALELGADWIWLVNNDAIVEPEAPEALVDAAAARPDAGVLACKIYFSEPRDVLWFAGGDFNLLLGYSGRQDGFGKRDDGSFEELRDIGRATGAGMAVSQAAIEAAGLLDEDLFAYVEDVDWCLRIREAGFAIVFVPQARIWHRVSATTGGERSTTNLYYDTRNTIAVCDRHRPLGPPFRGARRAVVVTSHLAQATLRPNRREAVTAVLRGWQDARRGKLGPREQQT